MRKETELKEQMKITVGKEFRFEAAHSLPHLPEGHKCRNVHGHSYRFRVDIEGPVDGRGFVIDYSEISEAVEPIVNKLDHQNLNDIFAQATTAENLAVWLFKQVEDKLGRCHRITLWETPTSVVVVEGGCSPTSSSHDSFASVFMSYLRGSSGARILK